MVDPEISLETYIVLDDVAAVATHPRQVDSVIQSFILMDVNSITRAIGVSKIWLSLECLHGVDVVASYRNCP